MFFSIYKVFSYKIFSIAIIVILLYCRYRVIVHFAFLDTGFIFEANRRARRT